VGIFRHLEENLALVWKSDGGETRILNETYVKLADRDGRWMAETRTQTEYMHVRNGARRKTNERSANRSREEGKGSANVTKFVKMFIEASHSSGRRRSGMLLAQTLDQTTSATRDQLDEHCLQNEEFVWLSHQRQGEEREENKET